MVCVIPHDGPIPDDFQPREGTGEKIAPMDGKKRVTPLTHRDACAIGGGLLPHMLLLCCFLRLHEDGTMFKEIFRQQRDGMEAMASTGVIGLHLVSGPLVGVAIGFGIDRWLDTGPWGKLVFLFVGIGAGFLNVYRDTRQLLRKMAKEDAAALRKGPSAESRDSREIGDGDGDESVGNSPRP
jgi:ATP synthase protein I